jgi:hypothetical protein
VKIIGIVKESNYSYAGTYLAELTKDEVAFLAGWPYYDARERPVVVGSEIPVDAMFAYLRKIADQPNKLQKAKDILEAVASLLQLPAVIVEAAEAVNKKA